MSTHRQFVISSTEAGLRLDIFCVGRLEGLSRSQIQQLIKLGHIKVNGDTVKPRHALRGGDLVEIDQIERQSGKSALPVEQPKIPIIYEDRQVVVINKPAGISAHQGNGTNGQTIADWFAYRYAALLPVGEPERSGIVHRLDKDTSGVMILAKTPEALEHLKKQFKNRRAKKEYLALVYGTPGETKGRITRALSRSKRNPTRRTVDPAGREAVTEWRVEEKLKKNFSLLRAYPLTGRTHQIRVHLHFLGFPIVGDALYVFKRQKPPRGVGRQMLHAETLRVILPGGQTKTFIAPLPDDFSQVLEELR